MVPRVLAPQIEGDSTRLEHNARAVSFSLKSKSLCENILSGGLLLARTKKRCHDKGSALYRYGGR